MSIAPVSKAELPDDVVGWIEDTTGGTVVAVDRRPGGGRKEAWFVDVKTAEGDTEALFLRFDRSSPAAADPWTIRREAVVYAALADSGVPVPALVGVHPTREAMLSRRVSGDTWFSRITDADERVATARDFVRVLARWHRLDPATLNLPGFARGSSVPALVHAQLDELDALVADVSPLDPALALSLRWLREHVPSHEGPAVLVQGDTGPGNFMYEGGRVTAVVDWEFAHVGDPMDDIAWLTLRATQEPFTELHERLQEYETLSGHHIDRDRVVYYQLLAEAKLQAMYQRASARGGATGRAGAADLGNALIYRMLHTRLWLEVLGVVLGVELDDHVDVSAPESLSDDSALFDAVLSQLRDVIVPRIDDPLARQRTKGVARTLKYLAQRVRLGPIFAARETAEIAALLQTPAAASLEAARAELVDAAIAGRVSDEDYVRCLWRRAVRDNEVLRSASGVLADRHWPAL